MFGQNGGNQAWGQGNSGGFGAAGGPPASNQAEWGGAKPQASQGGWMNTGASNLQGQTQAWQRNQSGNPKNNKWGGAQNGRSQNKDFGGGLETQPQDSVGQRQGTLQNFQQKSKTKPKSLGFSMQSQIPQQHQNLQNQHQGQRQGMGRARGRGSVGGNQQWQQNSQPQQNQQNMGGFLNQNMPKQNSQGSQNQLRQGGRGIGGTSGFLNGQNAPGPQQSSGFLAGAQQFSQQSQNTSRQDSQQSKKNSRGRNGMQQKASAPEPSGLGFMSQQSSASAGFGANTGFLGQQAPSQVVPISAGFLQNGQNPKNSQGFGNQNPGFGGFGKTLQPSPGFGQNNSTSGFGQQKTGAPSAGFGGANISQGGFGTSTPTSAGFANTSGFQNKPQGFGQNKPSAGFTQKPASNEGGFLSGAKAFQPNQQQTSAPTSRQATNGGWMKSNLQGKPTQLQASSFAQQQPNNRVFSGDSSAQSTVNVMNQPRQLSDMKNMIKQQQTWQQKNERPKEDNREIASKKTSFSAQYDKRKNNGRYQDDQSEDGPPLIKPQPAVSQQISQQSAKLPKMLQSKNSDIKQAGHSLADGKSSRSAGTYEDERDNGGDYGEEYGEEEYYDQEQQSGATSPQKATKKEPESKAPPQSQFLGQNAEGPNKTKIKMEPCLFHMMGSCRSGDRCHKLHLEGIPQVSDDQCKFFAFGQECKFNDTCRKKHDPEYQEVVTAQMMQVFQKYSKSLTEDNQQTQEIKKAPRVMANNQDEPEPSNLPIHKAIIKQPQQPVLKKSAPLMVAPMAQIKVPDLPVADPKQVQYINSSRYVAEKIQKHLTKLHQIQVNAEQHVVPGKAMSCQMCPQIHLDNPDRSKSHFERDQDGQQYELLAVKAYVRSGAGKDMCNPSLIRAPIVQYRAVKYMRDCIVDQDLVPPGQSFYEYQNQCFGEVRDISKASHSFNDVYSFIKDRTRQISQDLNMVNCIPNKYTVGSLEQMIRYLIVAQHYGISQKDFDLYSNRKQITGWQGDLKDKQYKVIKASSMTPEQKQALLKNEVEMLCYQIISSADSVIVWQKLVNEIGSLDDDYTPKDRQLLAEAIKIASSIQMCDSQRFFKQFRATNYMFACLMLVFFEGMRRAVLHMLGRSHRAGLVRGAYIQKQLLLPDMVDCFNCLTLYGFKPDPTTCDFVPQTREKAEDWQGSITRFRQQNLGILDEMARYSPQRLRRDAIKHGISLFLQDKGSVPQSILAATSSKINIQPKQIIQLQKTEVLPPPSQPAPSIFLQKSPVKLDQPAFPEKINNSSSVNQPEKSIQSSQEKPLLEADARAQEELERQQIEVKLSQKREKAEKDEAQRKLKEISSRLWEQLLVNLKQCTNEVRQEILRERQRLSQIQKAVDDAYKKAAREKQKKMLFSHVLRKMGRSQAYKDEQKRYQKKYIRKWFQVVSDLKQFKDIQEQRKVIEQYAGFLAKFGDVKSVEGLEAISKDVQIGKIVSTTVSQYLDFKQLEFNPNQELILLFTNQSQLSGFDKKINNCICNHFDHLALHPQIKLKIETSKSLFKGGFSAWILIAHDFDEIVEAARICNKHGDENQYGQINLSIVTVNITQSKQQIRHLFQKSEGSQLIGSLNIFTVSILEEHLNEIPKHLSHQRHQYLMESLIKHQFQDQQIMRVLREMEPQMMNQTLISCPFYDLLVHQSQNLTYNLSQNHGQKPSIEIFNELLLQFHNCLDDLVYKLSICAKDEFHYSDYQKRLKVTEPLNFVKQLLELQLIPDSGFTLTPQHLKFVYQRFFNQFPNLQTLTTEQAVDGQGMFKEFYQRVFQTVYDKNWQIMLLNAHVNEFQPFLLETKVKIPQKQDAQALIRDLKKRFPRDFGQLQIGKRPKMTNSNVVEIDPQEFETYVFHDKKRERKSRRKLGSPKQDYEACFDKIQQITNNKVRKFAEDMYGRSVESSLVGAVSPAQSINMGSVDSPMMIMESEEEGLSNLSKSSASVPAALVENMSTDNEDPIALAVNIQNKLKRAEDSNGFYLFSNSIDLDLDYQMLTMPITLDSPKSQVNLNQFEKDYGMSEITRTQQILLNC